MKKLLLTLAALLTATVSPAAIVQINLAGTFSNSLHFRNEPAVVSGGTGDEVLSGITFDDVAKTVTINVAWGSANGFADLTGVSTNAHLHQAANPNGNGGAGDWLQTGGVVVNIQTAPLQFTTNTSASAGGITGTSLPLSAALETALFQNRLYLNVHTGANGGGEIRGFLVPVPEPTTALFGLTALGALALRRRRA